jgi:uncharacterized phage infection (PIP) family protein YhgE
MPHRNRGWGFFCVSRKGPTVFTLTRTARTTDDVAALNKLVDKLQQIAKTTPAVLRPRGQELMNEIASATRTPLTADGETSRQAQLAIKVNRFKVAVADYNQVMKMYELETKAAKRPSAISLAALRPIRRIYVEGNIPVMRQILQDLRDDMFRMYKDAPGATQLDMDDLLREINAGIEFLDSSETEYPGIHHFVEISWTVIRDQFAKYEAAIAKAKAVSKKQIWILIASLSVIAEVLIFGLHWPWFGRTEEQKEMYRP